MLEKVKNVKIRVRLLLSYAVILVISLIASITALVMLKSAGDNLETFYDNNYTVTVNCWIARRSMQAARADMLRGILEVDLEKSEEMVESAKNNLTALRDTFPIIRDTFQGDIALVDEAEAVLDEAVTYREQIFSNILENKNDEAFAIMSEEYVPRLDQIADVLEKISNAVKENAQNMVRKGNNSVIAAIIIVAVIIIISICLAMVMGVVIANTISKPIQVLEKTAKEMASGSLQVEIDYSSQDEIGSLFESMRVMTDGISKIVNDIGFVLGEMAQGNFCITSQSEEFYKKDYRPIIDSIYIIRNKLNEALGNIHESAEQVTMGSVQMSESSQSLAEGASEQAGAVEELTAAIESVTQMAEKSADKTNHAYLDAEESSKRAEVGSAEMEKLTEAMERINVTSKEIENIIVTIEDIASQTNLLSLNASIEAARAGEAGKGFAVVADQIGKLASESGQAAVNTKELIIRTLEEIDSGNAITAKTAQSFKELIENIKKFAVVAKGTSEMSVSQANSLKQIQDGVEQISAVVQSNSAVAEETSATSEELSAQAETLKSLVGQFRLLNE